MNLTSFIIGLIILISTIVGISILYIKKKKWFKDNLKKISAIFTAIIVSSAGIMLLPTLEPSIPEPYIWEYFEAPESSFGFESGWIKTINWTYYWSLWENSSNWLLEYTSKIGDPWLNYTQYLDIDYIRSDGLEKQIINFTAPDTGYYRANFTVVGNITNASFIPEDYEYRFDLGIPNTRCIMYITTGLMSYIVVGMTI